MLLPRSWYPLCRSRDVRPGRAIAVDGLGARWCVFRSAAGRIGVLDARCSHLGADLSRGRVDGDGVRCPLHGRCFASGGARLDAAGPGQRSLATAERYGLVFAFAGGAPDFPLPGPDGIADTIVTPARIAESPLGFELLGCNAFDTAHLAEVHGRTLLAAPRIERLSAHAIRVAFAAAVTGRRWRDRLLRRLGHDRVEIDITCWGGSLLIFHHRRVATFTVHAALPVAARRTVSFTVSGRAAGAAPWTRLRERARLRGHHRAALSFVREDERALAGMDLHPGDLDPVADESLGAWLGHFAALPRTQAGP